MHRKIPRNIMRKRRGNMNRKRTRKRKIHRKPNIKRIERKRKLKGIIT